MPLRAASIIRAVLVASVLVSRAATGQGVDAQAMLDRLATFDRAMLQGFTLSGRTIMPPGGEEDVGLAPSGSTFRVSREAGVDGDWGVAVRADGAASFVGDAGADVRNSDYMLITSREVFIGANSSSEVISGVPRAFAGVGASDIGASRQNYISQINGAGSPSLTLPLNMSLLTAGRGYGNRVHTALSAEPLSDSTVRLTARGVGLSDTGTWVLEIDTASGWLVRGAEFTGDGDSAPSIRISTDGAVTSGERIFAASGVWIDTYVGNEAREIPFTFESVSDTPDLAFIEDVRRSPYEPKPNWHNVIDYRYAEVYTVELAAGERYRSPIDQAVDEAVESAVDDVLDVESVGVAMDDPIGPSGGEPIQRENAAHAETPASEKPKSFFAPGMLAVLAVLLGLIYAGFRIFRAKSNV